ncbi:hypothetical protein DUNSADRAFT_7609 [Dunaliella salina]|uniref:Encoded protein n=1 Tax=Dunaliella salina TaxID=3046 RepID=A0ABQ7GL01_DUNSA|nr:hypothetical protein DUNSADRAFT_7609 [Dunaliella salina]|eukprot:KAF5835284.1 hypothetical protein DUNSADRAFT_7609 [Dunaliella salina]
MQPLNMKASSDKPSPFLLTFDTDFGGVFRSSAPASNNGQAIAEVLTSSLRCGAEAPTSRFSPRTPSTEPQPKGTGSPSTKQVLQQSQFGRSQTSVGFAATSSALECLMTAENSAGLPLPPAVDIPGSSSSCPPLPYDSDFLLGLKQRSSLSPYGASASQEFSLPSCPVLDRNAGWPSCNGSPRGTADHETAQVSRCRMAVGRPHNFKGLSSYLHGAKGRDATADLK